MGADSTSEQSAQKRKFFSFQAKRRIPAQSIGLDVGSSSVKGVKFDRAGSKLKLASFSVVPIVPKASVEEHSQAIKKVLTDCQAGETPVFTAVGGTGSVLRSIFMPKMSPSELASALKFEAEKYIPFKSDDAIIDSFILGERSGNRMEVILAAAKKELVKGHLDVLDTSGVRPWALDLEALALANAWENAFTQGDSQARCLLHVGVRGTLLVFFKGAQLQFTREIAIGGDAFTLAVSEGLGMEAAAAEALKCQPGERWAQVQSALAVAWQGWVSQCRASFDFYENQYGHGVEQLVLSGGSTKLNQFKESVETDFGVAAQLWNPVGGLELEGKLSAAELESHRVELGVAVGLGVRGVS